MIKSWRQAFGEAMIADNRMLEFVVLIFMSTPLYLAGETVEQMRNNAKMLRDICQPKFQLSNEVADAIRDGVIPEDNQNAKCYINCILEMMNSIDKGKINYDVTMKQIDISVPDEWKPAFRTGVDACRNAIDGIENNCDAAATLLKCLTTNIKEFKLP